MANKQTAVEFLLAELDIAHLIAREKLTMASEVVRQAKQMEKEQLKDAYKTAYNYYQSAEEFYNENYGK